MPTKVDVMQELVEVYSKLYELTKMNNEEVRYKVNQIFNNLKYTPKEIESTLKDEKNKNLTVKLAEKQNKRSKKTNLIIINIKTEEQVRDYYNNVLSKYYNPKITVEEKTNILKNVTINDLVYLISIISNVKIPKGIKKSDLLYIIRRYFDNMSRTEAMK